MKGISKDQKTISVNLKAKVVGKNDMTCIGCWFEGESNNCINMGCCASERKDGKNIIWVEAEK